MGGRPGDGLDGPTAPSVLPDDARRALADLARMRAQMLAMAKDMGQMEKRLRAMLREDAE